MTTPNAPRLSRAGKNPNGSTTYTFTDANGEAFHVLPCNDEKGNPDRKAFEVYTDRNGSPDSFNGTHETLRDIRETYTYAADETETEDEPRGWVATVAPYTEADRIATETAARRAEALAAKYAAEDAARVAAYDAVNRRTVIVHGTHTGETWDCATGRPFACTLRPAFGDRPDMWSASAPGFGCSRDYATPEDAARNLARENGVKVQSARVQSEPVDTWAKIDAAFEAVSDAADLAERHARDAENGETEAAHRKARRLALTLGEALHTPEAAKVRRALLRAGKAVETVNAAFPVTRADRMSDALLAIYDAPEGATVYTEDGRTNRYVVGGVAPALTFATVEDFRAHVGAPFASLYLIGRQNGADCFGTWTDTETGTVYVDACDTWATETYAMSAARQRGELAIYDRKTGEALTVETASHLAARRRATGDR